MLDCFRKKIFVWRPIGDLRRDDNWRDGWLHYSPIMTFQLTCPRAYLFSNRGMTPNNAVGVEEVITMEYTELEDAGRNIGIVSL